MLAPLIIDKAPPREGRARTLCIAFSSLGWHGLVRTEWAHTLRAAAAAASLGPLDLAHALDTSRAWFMTHPLSGELDDGAWWERKLEELCAPYEVVCLVGESMGGSAALRFARHATSSGSVVALAPQIDLRDFECCSRADFDAARKLRLRDAICAACASRRGRVSVHVGRDYDDLLQLAHLADVPELRRAFDSLGEEPADPLPRDGCTLSQSIGSRLRVVKHDIEGHAVGAALKARGELTSLVLDCLFTPEARAAACPTHVICGGGGGGWVAAAAASLDVHGYVTLSSGSTAEPLVPRATTEACREVAAARLEELLAKVERRGVSTSDDFRFAEIVHREGLRYDAPLDWSLELDPSASETARFVRRPPSGSGGVDDTGALGALLEAADVLARATLTELVASTGRGSLLALAAPPTAGCVTSVPSASAQSWHSDGPSDGLYNVFVPLVSLTPSNGPTEIRPGTHTASTATRGFVLPRVAPLLEAGELLIFDQRCRHRGLPNHSTQQRPIAYITYGTGFAKDRNFRDAATLAWD